MRIFNIDFIVQEGIYLFNHDIDPYSGGSFRHVRLLLATRPSHSRPYLRFVL